MLLNRIHKILKAIAVVSIAAAASSSMAADTLIDGMSFEAAGGPDVRMVRLGAQADWSKRWFQGNGRHLTGYWDLSLAQWRGSAYRSVRGDHQNITSIGFTPVLRYQADDHRGWYAEGGIGANVLSHVYDNGDKQLSTAFQFGDHIGVGYVFANQWDLGLKLQHYSNASIKKPNDGVNFVVVKLGRAF